MVGIVAPPEEYRTLSGGKVEEKEMDPRVRLLFMNRLHESIAGSGSFDVLGFSRTARRLMAGTAYCPPLDQTR
jgi:2-methylaconitate cis-trans-isomerase PrpF